MTRLGYVLMTLGLLAMLCATGEGTCPLWLALVIGLAGVGLLAAGAWMAGLFYGEEDER